MEDMTYTLLEVELYFGFDIDLNPWLYCDWWRKITQQTDS